LVYPNCQTPSEEGCYVCEIDLVHELISWFRDKGSTPLRLDIVVRNEESRDIGAADAQKSNDNGLREIKKIRKLKLISIYPLIAGWIPFR